jgi:hypothetical protein
MSENASINRPKRIRRAILRAAESAKAMEHGIDGLTLEECLDVLPLLQRPVDRQEIIGLARDLVHLGLLEERDTRERRNQPFCLDFLMYSITAKGSGLLAGVEPKQPLVDDERI